MLQEIFKIAIRNLKRRAVRSILTIIGISIGIASIILFVSIGVGIKNIVIGSFGEVGNELIVTPSVDESGEASKLSMKDLRQIEKIKGVLSVSPRLQDFFYLEYRGAVEPCIVIGVDAVREKKMGVDMLKGRFLKKNEKFSAVLGFKRQNISKTHDKNKGKTIQINVRRYIKLKSFEEEKEYRFKVVGILKESGLAGQAFFGGDNAVVVPIETLRKISNSKEEISYIVVKLEDPRSADRVSRKIEKITNANVISMKKLIESINKFFKIVQMIFFAIGSIALIVAGLGIMNTMLMSILERTREIGILKAIGAKKKDILKIFLAEAGIIGLIGGLIGVLFGFIISNLGNIAAKHVLSKSLGIAVAEIPAIIQTPPWLFLFAILFSTVISTIFGLYPALKASSLDPVEALRRF